MEKLHTKYGILAVMGIGLFGRMELVEFENVVDEFLLAGGGGTGWEGALGGGGGHFVVGGGGGGGGGRSKMIVRSENRIKRTI